MVTISKQDVVKIVIVVWFIGTSLYVVYDFYDEFKNRAVRTAYQNGYTEGINELIEKSNQNNCEPLEIRIGDKSAQLVRGECLQAGVQNEASSVNETVNQNQSKIAKPSGK